MRAQTAKNNTNRRVKPRVGDAIGYYDACVSRKNLKPQGDIDRNAIGCVISTSSKSHLIL